MVPERKDWRALRLGIGNLSFCYRKIMGSNVLDELIRMIYVTYYLLPMLFCHKIKMSSQRRHFLNYGIFRKNLKSLFTIKYKHRIVGSFLVYSYFK